jgi:hypothetical protein
MPPFVGPSDLAGYFKLSLQQVQNLTAKGLPRNSRTGKYDVPDAIEWRYEQLRAQ